MTTRMRGISNIGEKNAASAQRTASGAAVAAAAAGAATGVTAWAAGAAAAWTQHGRSIKAAARKQR